jgi:hypothetical protein
VNPDQLEKLADTLERLASTIEANPGPVIGQKIVAIAQPGATGPTIGMNISVTAQPGSQGTVIGNKVSVTTGKRNEEEVQVIRELKDAAAMLRDRKAPKSWIVGLLDRVKGLGSRAIDAGAIAGAQALAESAFS